MQQMLRVRGKNRMLSHGKIWQVFQTIWFHFLAVWRLQSANISFHLSYNNFGFCVKQFTFPNLFCPVSFFFFLSFRVFSPQCCVLFKRLSIIQSKLIFCHTRKIMTSPRILRQKFSQESSSPRNVLTVLIASSKSSVLIHFLPNIH